MKVSLTSTPNPTLLKDLDFNVLFHLGDKSVGYVELLNGNKLIVWLRNRHGNAVIEEYDNFDEEETEVFILPPGERVIIQNYDED